MSKVTEKITNFFRSRSPRIPVPTTAAVKNNIDTKLTIDAAPMAPRSDADIRLSNVANGVTESSSMDFPPNMLTNGSSTSDMDSLYNSDHSRNNSLAIEEISNPENSLAVRRNNDSCTTLTNNTVLQPIGQVNNTQACTVYQFSHISGLHIGPVINYTAEQSTSASPVTEPVRRVKTKSGKADIRKTKSIDAMFHSQEPLEHKYLDIIATHLGEGWEGVARSLGFSEGQLHQFRLDNYISGVKEIIYQFLLDWSQNDETACLGKISKLLWKLEHRETIYILKEYWKKNNLPNGKEI